MANKQVNIRLPKQLLKEGEEIVRDHNFKNLQHLVVEGLRQIILEHRVKKEIEAIKQFQEFHGVPEVKGPSVKELAKTYGVNRFK